MATRERKLSVGTGISERTDGPLPALLLLLTFVTGVVDSVSFFSLGRVFVANMTGNVAFVGFALAGAPGFAAATSLDALGAFALGSVVGGQLGRMLGRHRGRLLAAGSGTQMLLVAAATAMTAARGQSNALQYSMIALLAAGMGVQNAAVRKLGVADLSTTVLTQAIAALFIGEPMLRGPGTARRIFSICFMLCGALVGSLVLLRVARFASLSIALGLVASVALSSALLSRHHQRWQDAA